MNYRLSGEAPFPAAIRDVKAAIKFIRAHGVEYSVDKSKGLVWGGSAGGHLAALAALTCGIKEFEPELPANPSPDPCVCLNRTTASKLPWLGMAC
ncbi:MAG: alpha/beta hydrolase [Steroidobacteraceae bacterium]